MPSIDDVYRIATSLGKNHVAIRNERCAAVRHRASHCRRCIEICPADAIRVAANEVTIDSERCDGCGACCAVCPTEVFTLGEPSPEDIRDYIDSKTAGAADQSGTEAIALCCARKDATHAGDASKYLCVPCLSCLEERDLLYAAACGADELLLIDGDCATCKYRALDSAIDETVAQTRHLLSLLRREVALKRTSEFPGGMRISSADARKDARRGFLNDTKNLAKEAASKILTEVVDEGLADLGIPKQSHAKPTMLERLGMARYGWLPRFEASRNVSVLDSLELLGADEERPLESRLFYDLAIQSDKCSGCGLCYAFCPTHALMEAVDEVAVPDRAKGLRPLEFIAADCVGCGLCTDLCARQCLTLSPANELQDILKLEPKIVWISDVTTSRNKAFRF